MAIIYLADAVRQDPSIAQVSWNEVHTAVQETLPGSDFHDRYREFAHVGVAGASVGDHMTAGSMNPLESAIQDGRDPETLIENMPFFASNKHLYPDVWATQPQDERLLGGPVPELLGRYGAFALAKINALTGTIGKSSFNHVRLNLGPGRSGFAGGIRDYHALLSISGLWEVHDHVVAGLFADDVAARTGKVQKSGQSKTKPKNSHAYSQFLNGNSHTTTSYHLPSAYHLLLSYLRLTKYVTSVTKALLLDSLIPNVSAVLHIGKMYAVFTNSCVGMLCGLSNSVTETSYIQYSAA